MKILFATPYLPSLVRVRPYNFIKELSRRHEVWVVATDSARELGAVDGLRSLCHRVEVVPLVPAEIARGCATSAARGEPLQAGFCRSRRLSGLVSSLLAGGDFDVVHVEHLRGAHLGAAIPPAMPTLYDAVDCISLLLERTMRSSHSLAQRLVAAVELRRTRAYEAGVLRRFDRVIATAPEDAAALRAMSPRTEVEVVPNGVDLDYFRPVVGPREAATLVFSGKMSYHANVSAVLHFVRHIFPLVRQERPETRLLIVGSKPPKVVRDLAEDSAISVTGYLPDIRETVSRATVAICPVTVKVGVQNKVLEAMALGLPVVATKGGAQGLAARAGRDLLVADTPAEFAGQVGRLLGDAALRDNLGRAGRRYVEEHHRWAAAAERVESLYRRAIEQHGVPSASR